MRKLLIGMIILCLLVPSVVPLSFGINIDSRESESHSDLLLSDYYSVYSLEEIPESIRPIISEDEVSTSISKTENSIKTEDSPKPLSPPMDSPWPMYCHDVRHTGQSPYITASNAGNEQWRFDVLETCTGSPVIDNDGIIYIGAFDLFAVYPNGTLKWIFDADSGIITSAPAIDENGILYIGSIWKHPNLMYAIYTSNGTLKWKYKVGGDIWSSPAIGNDGSIYFGSENDYIYALNPNGTLKWKYLTSVAVYSSPAIGEDGTVYCGSHDTYLYAFYPNNGTVKWKYKTGHWIRTSPCIGDDGTIYAVSLDDNLYALYPNGTLKWKKDVGAGTSPTIGQDGTIYCGYERLHAVNPDGTIKWSFEPGEKRQIRGATPCNSADDIIYFGTHIGETDGGELIAVNSDGSERWRLKIATVWTDSAPAIGEDGTIYIGTWDIGPPYGWGYLHAIGELDPDAPSEPEINGPKKGEPFKQYSYTFKSTSSLGRNIYYNVDWGDQSYTGWFGPFESGEIVTRNHSWYLARKYNIIVRAKDTEELFGPWGYFEVQMPRNKETSYSFFFQFLERFPMLKLLLSYLEQSSDI